MGFGQIDKYGNVNASKLGGLPVGPGGFIDIAQNARKVVFVGTFDAKGTKVSSGNGKLTVHQNGAIAKFVEKVDQITFAGEQAALRGQEVIYVTERAVFRLTANGIALTEVAPGVCVEKDVLKCMSFTPTIDSKVEMDKRHFMSDELVS